jgi:hypothetical protein
MYKPERGTGRFYRAWVMHVSPVDMVLRDSCWNVSPSFVEFRKIARNLHSAQIGRQLNTVKPCTVDGKKLQAAYQQ